MVILLWTLIATLAIYTYNSEKEFRTKHLNEDLRLINSRVINAYENDMELKPFMNFISQYYEKSEFNGIRMSVYQEDGTLLYCIGTPIPTQIDGEYTPEFAKMLDKGYGTSFRRSSVEDNNPYYFFGCVKVPMTRYLSLRRCLIPRLLPRPWLSTRAYGLCLYRLRL